MKKWLLFLLVLNFAITLPSMADEQPSEVTEETSTLGEIGEFLAPSNLKGEIKKEIAELNISARLRFFDLDIMNGINLAGGYKIEVEPSYADGFYTRVDRWNLSAAVNAGDILENSSPVYLNISRDQEVIFVRQFKKQLKAIKSLPIPVWKMPLTAKKALELEPGTFISLPSKLNISVGANAVAQYSAITAKANAFYLISGDFMIHIFRLKDNKVRLKLIATKKRGRGFNVGAEVGFDVFELSVIGKQIEKIVGSDLLKLGFIKEKGSLFMIDYLMDLNDEKAQKAYNDILSSTYKFKESRLANAALLDIFGKGKKPHEMLISNLDTAEALYNEDKDKENKRIDRMFKGTNEFQRSSLNLKVEALNFAQMRRANSFTDNRLTYFNRDNEKENLVYTTYMKNRKFKLLFGLTEEKTDRNTFTLFKSDEEGNILEDGFSDYGFSYERKDKHFGPIEQKKVQAFLKINLPPEIYNIVEWDKIIDGESQRKARVYYRVLFKEETIAGILDNDKKYLAEKLLEAQKRYKSDYLNFFEKLTIGQRFVLWLQRKGIVNKLHKILTTDISKMSRREKIEKFVKLQRHPLFSRIGLGFLFSLLTEEGIRNGVEFEFKWSSDQVETKRYTYGKSEQRTILSSLEYIQSALNSRSFDLRLVGYDPATELQEEEVLELEETRRERRARERAERQEANAERVLQDLERGK